jgi:hypothetical protein
MNFFRIFFIALCLSGVFYTPVCSAAATQSKLPSELENYEQYRDGLLKVLTEGHEMTSWLRVQYANRLLKLRRIEATAGGLTENETAALEKIRGELLSEFENVNGYGDRYLKLTEDFIQNLVRRTPVVLEHIQNAESSLKILLKNDLTEEDALSVQALAKRVYELKRIATAKGGLTSKEKFELGNARNALVGYFKNRSPGREAAQGLAQLKIMESLMEHRDYLRDILTLG